jgi:hypothetical protein
MTAAVAMTAHAWRNRVVKGGSFRVGTILQNCDGSEAARIPLSFQVSGTDRTADVMGR